MDWHHGRIGGKFAKLHDTNAEFFERQLRELRERLWETEAELKVIHQRLGYEDLRRKLSEDIPFAFAAEDTIRECRERDLGSLFPRVLGLEVALQMLEGTMKTVFEINGLKNLKSLTKEERIQAWSSEKAWP